MEVCEEDLCYRCGNINGACNYCIVTGENVVNPIWECVFFKEINIKDREFTLERKRMHLNYIRNKIEGMGRDTTTISGVEMYVSDAEVKGD